MRNETLQSMQEWAKQQLEISTRFWLQYGMDAQHGGMYSCLDRTGVIYSTDKAVWMQGRCAWTFAHLCRQYGARQEWLNAAKSCLDFLEAHCINREAGNRMYFQVTAEGNPLRQRRYCFSEAFYIMGNAEYYAVTGDETYLQRAREAYQLVRALNHNEMVDPTGIGAKTIPETRRGRALADSMIFLNLSTLLHEVDAQHTAEYARYAGECADTILKYHRKPHLHCTLETVGMQGEFWEDVTVGRIVNPGHDIECAWFLMEHANKVSDQTLHQAAQEMCRDALEHGWDKEYGGLLYFTDCMGKPTEAYEHDMKLWWPHTEMLVACAMAYRDTKNDYYLKWLEKAVAYCKQYFVDEQYGEWYGYLRRDGQPTQPTTKGSSFKGPFHLPRALMMLDKILGEVINAER